MNNESQKALRNINKFTIDFIRTENKVVDLIEFQRLLNIVIIKEISKCNKGEH